MFKNDKEIDSIFVMTWDLELNQEHSLAQIDISDIPHPEHLVCKGVQQKLNYIVTENCFYDFQYMLPFKSLLAKDDKFQIGKSVNERKLSSNK